MNRSTVHRATDMFAPMFAVVLLALVLVLAPAPAMAAPPPPSGAPADVTVMTFNVWLGGDVVDFGKVVEAIRAPARTSSGCRRPRATRARIAEALGWPYWSDRLHVVSRFPLIDPPEAKRRVRARPDPARPRSSRCRTCT